MKTLQDIMPEYDQELREAEKIKWKARFRYEYLQTSTNIAVYLDKKKVGRIKRLNGGLIKGFQYCPYGSKSKGDVYNTLAECRDSIEEI